MKNGVARGRVFRVEGAAWARALSEGLGGVKGASVSKAWGVRGKVTWNRAGSVVPGPAGLGLIPRSSSLLFGALSVPVVVIVRDKGRCQTWSRVYLLFPHQALILGVWFHLSYSIRLNLAIK